MASFFDRVMKGRPGTELLFVGTLQQYPEDELKPSIHRKYFFSRSFLF